MATNCRPIFLFVLEFSDKRYSKDQSIITEIVWLFSKIPLNQRIILLQFFFSFIIKI